MRRILIVGGESPGSQTAVAASAMSEAFPLLAADPSEARDLLAREQPDLVVVDCSIRSPGDSEVVGLMTLCSESAPHVPVLALIPNQGLADYAHAGGFDDFSISPHRPQELVLRMKRLIERADPQNGDQTIRAGDLAIDLSRYEVTQGGRRMELTFKEYELLKFFATNPGKVFSREHLLNAVWGYDYYGGTRTVDVHIRRLRSKIENGPLTFIDTVRNVGYRFRDDV